MDTSTIINTLSTVDGWLWDYFLPALLIITGLFFTIGQKGRFTFKLPTLFRNTIGLAARRNENTEQKGTISAFAAAMTNLGNTVGTGNISGVATAIASGGPGAVFWMWIIAIVGMATKSSEIMLGLRYRIKSKETGEHMCNRDYIMGRTIGWKVPAAIFAFLAVLTQPLNAISQANSIVESLNEAFGLNRYLIVSIVVVLLVITICGGLKRISKVATAVVPYMCGLYLLAGLAIIIINITVVPSVIASIFKYAFTPMAGVGGVAGFTVQQAFRFGCARGCYSNDSGIGAAMCTYSTAKVDHPARQACWGWGENFVDTILVCTVTSIAILTSQTWLTGTELTGGALATAAFGDAFGFIGTAFLAIANTFFAWTTLSSTFYQNTISLDYLLGKNKGNKVIYGIWIAYYCLPQFIGGLDADIAWLLADFSGVCNIICTVTILFVLRKEVFRLSSDFFDRFLPAKKRGENPPPVTYEEVA